MSLVSGGFVLFVEVKDHQSCIDFPHCHFIGWREEGKGEITELGFGGERGQKSHRKHEGEWVGKQRPTVRTSGHAQAGAWSSARSLSAHPSGSHAGPSRSASVSSQQRG